MAIRSTFRTAVDIAVQLDGTASMGWCIEELCKNISDFAGDLVEQNLDWRMGLYVFRDLKKGEKPEFHDFTTDIAAFQRLVGSVESNGGGGNDGESSIDACFDCLDKYEFRDRSTRCFMLFTDEPPHDPDEYGRTMKDLIRELQVNKIITYVVSSPLATFQALADSYGGLHFDIKESRGGFRKLLFSVTQSMSAVTMSGSMLRDAATAALKSGKLDAPTRVLNFVPDEGSVEWGDERE